MSQNQQNLKTLFKSQRLPLGVGLLSFWILNKSFFLYHTYLSDTASDKLDAVNKIMAEPFKLMKLPLISLKAEDLCIPLMIAFVIYMLIFARSPKKNMRSGEEQGSAHWADKDEIKKFMDKDPRKNIILTATEGLTMQDWLISPTNGRNKNVLLIGGPGTGKTRFFVLPNLLQMYGSYVVTDPKGTILPDIGDLLLKGGYKIKVLNLKELDKSMHYNPLSYLKTELDVLKFANMLTTATKAADEKEDFWVKAERLLYSAVLGLIIFEGNEKEKNIDTLIQIIDASKTSENDETFENAVDMLFNDVAKENPESFAVRQYKKYKLAAGKSAKSVLLSCGVRLSPFDIKEIRELTSHKDELELDKLGEEKTALFVITSDTDSTLNFLAAFLYMQMFNLLCDNADIKHGGKLPIPVRCILDEFRNIGKIPMFEQLITTLRSRNISACPIVQTKSQLKAVYKDDAETIAGGCDTTLFLGGQEKSTLKDMSELLGSQTIDVLNSSRSYGKNRSDTSSYQKTARKLMDESEVFRLPGEKCILTIRGAAPWISDKYDITKHPNYEHLAKGSRKFDISGYLELVRKQKENPDVAIGEKDIVEVYETEE